MERKQNAEKGMIIESVLRTGEYREPGSDHGEKMERGDIADGSRSMFSQQTYTWSG
jgi:hypothetical protein